MTQILFVTTDRRTTPGPALSRSNLQHLLTGSKADPVQRLQREWAIRMIWTRGLRSHKHWKVDII